ncbi:hypothetical protein Nos7524_1092 [Nostoc sp. PCC 7524]|nr:hypothetical protein Nos7524_1092 [Nostoc sp. PCC 7524]
MGAGGRGVGENQYCLSTAHTVVNDLRIFTYLYQFVIQMTENILNQLILFNKYLKIYI